MTSPYIGALPIPHNKKIMHVCQSTDPSRKRGVEIFKILGTPGDLTRNALHDRDKFFERWEAPS
jgi:hypothetical protein